MSKFKEFLKEASYSGKIEDIKIDNIDPEDKDVVRVQSLNIAKAESMAKKITDPIKLVRRTKAYVLRFDNVENPFIDRMIEMGFTTKQILSLSKYEMKEPEPELADTVKRSGPYGSKRSRGQDRRYVIMNASSVYKGKISKVASEQYGDTVILLGTANGSRKIAVIGSASGMKITENGLDYYDIPKNGELDYKINTGNGYREPQSEIDIHDYVFVKDGKPVTKFKDASYFYYAFK